MLRVTLALALSAAVSAAVSAQCDYGPPPVVYYVVPAYAPVYDPVMVAPSGGVLTRLNTPFRAGTPVVPGVANPSLLGFAAPRLSIANNFVQAGGFDGPDARRFVVGMVSPQLGSLAAFRAGEIGLGRAALGVASTRGLSIARLISRN